MPNILELPPEEQAKYKRAKKIARLRWLQRQYRAMKLGASKRDREALSCEEAVLAKRLEVAQRDDR